MFVSLGQIWLNRHLFHARDRCSSTSGQGLSHLCPSMYARQVILSGHVMRLSFLMLLSVIYAYIVTPFRRLFAIVPDYRMVLIVDGLSSVFELGLSQAELQSQPAKKDKMATPGPLLALRTPPEVREGLTKDATRAVYRSTTSPIARLACSTRSAVSESVT
jgi:hypothetical protein